MEAEWAWESLGRTNGLVAQAGVATVITAGDIVQGHVPQGCIYKSEAGSLGTFPAFTVGRFCVCRAA